MKAGGAVQKYARASRALIRSLPMNAAAEHEQMVAVGPGKVTLTDRRTRHTWTLELAPYLLAAVPVTQARYADVTGQSPSTARGDDLPVECVSWLAAVRYCNALS